MPINLSDIREYYMYRMRELLDRNTIDSFRVRSHNSLSLLKELYELTEGWKQKRIKQFSTVQYCIDEIISKINFEPDILEFPRFSKDVFIEILNNYGKTAEKEYKSTEKVQYFLCEIIHHNNKKYLSVITSKIENILYTSHSIDDKDFIPYFSTLDILLHSFCCELINSGHSKRYLYFKSKDLIADYKESGNFDSAYNSFIKAVLDFSEKKYKVAIRCSLNGSLQGLNAWPEGFMPTLPKELVEQYSKIRPLKVEESSNIGYYLSDESALDLPQAIEKAKAHALSTLDSFHFAFDNLRVEFTYAIIFKEENGQFYWYKRPNITTSLDGGITDNRMDTEPLMQSLLSIIKNAKIKKETVDRIISACRHIRVGNASQEIGQSFINYWIGLEFLYSSPDNDENTIGRLKVNLVSILVSCYSKRNLLYIESKLKGNKVFKALSKRLWELGEKELDQVAQCSNITLKYKLMKLKSRFWGNTDKTKRYLKCHRDNLERQIARIYKIRNELIHEAAIKTDIERISSNLRYYLLFSLVQIIEYLSSRDYDGIREYGMDDFFHEYYLIEAHLNRNPNLEELTKVPINKLLVV